MICVWRQQKNPLPRVVLHSYWRYSWETIPSSHNCLIWSSCFLSQTWNSLACVWKIKSSHLQGGEPCPRDQLDEMYMLKLKTFVYYSPSSKCSLTTDLNTEECINIHACQQKNSISFLYFSASTKYLSFSVGNIFWAGYKVPLAVVTLPNIWPFFPFRYTWALFSPKLDIFRVFQW